MLHPGETLTVKAESVYFGYDDNQNGTYEFWATYQPPYISPADQKILHESGIDFAEANLITAHVSFDRK